MNRPLIILVLGVACTPLYLALALGGDLRGRPSYALAAHALLVVAMAAAWWFARGAGFPRRTVLVFALLFRLVAPWGAPTLSDDVWRYVWDGRLQRAGVHPYVAAPDDPALETYRDRNWERINHREVPTIYPPLAQALFALLGVGGSVGIRVALGLLDFVGVLALERLLRRLRAPPERLLLYAWNPLAIVEGAGSGHVDVAGALLVTLTVLALVERRPARAACAWVAAVLLKLLPLIWAPSVLRRTRVRALVPAALLAAAIVVPYAATGPIVPPGLAVYAERWERNGPVYRAAVAGYERLDAAEPLKRRIAAVQRRLGDRVDLTPLYRHVWPRDLARATLAALALAWIAFCCTRREWALEREFLAIAVGVLLLQPTIHPWYLLWCLPLAAARASLPVLLWAALVPLAYVGGARPLPAWVLALEYGPPALAAVVLATMRRR